MIDLPELVRKEMKPYEEVYKLWHGSDADAASVPEGAPEYPSAVGPPVPGPGYTHPQYPGAAPAAAPARAPEGGGAEQEWAQEFSMPPTAGGVAPPSPQPPAPSAPPSSTRGGRGGRGGRGRGGRGR